MTQLLTVQEVSSYLRVSPCTVRRRVKGQDIPFIRRKGIGIRFKREDIDKWLESSSSRPLLKTPLLEKCLKESLTPPSGGDRNPSGGTRAMPKGKSKARHNFGYGAIYQRKTKQGIVRWYLDYRDAAGKRVQRVEDGASSREEAEAALRKAVLAEFARVPGASRRKGRIMFNDFSLIFVDDYAKNVKRSWRLDKYRLGILEPFFKDIYLDEVTPLLVQKCLAWRLKSGNSKSTVNRYLALLKKMFSLAIEEGFLETNPAAKIKKSSEKDCLKERILTEDEEARLKNASYAVLRSVICVALNTGMRHGEILNLKWDQVDLEAQTLRVKKTKSGRPRTIPLNPPLLEELRKLRSQNGHGPYLFPNPDTGKPLRSMKTSFGAACRRAGITGLRFHDLRHTFGSRLVQKGVDIETVRSLLGHSSIAVTQRYVHSTDERRKSAVDKLVEADPIGPQKGLNLLHGCDTAEKNDAAKSQNKFVNLCFSEN
jgi:excisionase family DNA binding protein